MTEIAFFETKLTLAWMPSFQAVPGGAEVAEGGFALSAGPQRITSRDYTVNAPTYTRYICDPTA